MIILIPVFVFSASQCDNLRVAQELVQRSRGIPCQLMDMSNQKFVLYRSGFTSEFQKISFGLKVKPQQPAENAAFPYICAFMIHAHWLRAMA